MIDNSASMSDEQATLRLAVPDLVGRLVNPVCVDAEGNRGDTPPPGAACPAGQAREFNAIGSAIAFVGGGLGDNTTTFVACKGASFTRSESDAPGAVQFWINFSRRCMILCFFE